MFARDPLASPEPLIRRIYAYVAYRIGDGPEAEDITSDTLERALRYRSSYKPSQGEPIRWLIGIARRCIADSVKARLELAEIEDTAAPGQLEEDTVRRLDLARTVAMLDERDRELIALRYGADLTAKQIGALLSMHTNAVEVALHRTLTRLRTELEDPHAEEGSGAQTGRPVPE